MSSDKWIHSLGTTTSIVRDFYHSKKFSCSYSPPEPLIYCHCIVLPFLKFHINGIIKSRFLCLIFHSAKCFWDSHMILHKSVIPSFLLNSIPLCVYIPWLIHSPFNGHFGGIMNKAIMNIQVQVEGQIFHFSWVNT